MARVYKVVAAEEWREAQRAGVFGGAEIDRRDGYIHLSTGAQVEKTVELYFAARDDLVLVAVNSDEFGDALKWEPSRGGALFPHLYESLRVDRAVFAKRFSSHDMESLLRLIAEA